MTPNVAKTISFKAWNPPAEYPSWVARCDIKGSHGTMLNPIFWMKVQGQKHPGRWGIVEHQIPSIKVLFKTNVKSHKHPGIKLLSSESKRQLVNQRKQNSYRICIYIYIYIYISTQNFWTGTKENVGNAPCIMSRYRSSQEKRIRFTLGWVSVVYYQPVLFISL